MEIVKIRVIKGKPEYFAAIQPPILKMNSVRLKIRIHASSLIVRWRSLYGIVIAQVLLQIPVAAIKSSTPILLRLNGALKV